MSAYSKLDITIGRVTPQLGIRHIVALVLICLSASTVFAQRGTGTIRGTVVDEVTREIIQNVEIGVHLHGQQIAEAVTDEDGRFFFVGIDANTEYHVIASKSGYRTVHTTQCQVNRGLLTFCDFQLQAGSANQEPLILIHFSSDTTRAATERVTCRGPAPRITTVAGLPEEDLDPKISSHQLFDKLLGTPAMKENKQR